jgi:type I restriction enzyme S subunit
MSTITYMMGKLCIGRKGTIDKPYFHSGKIWTVDTLFYTYNFQNSYPLYLYYKFCLIDWLSYNEATGVPSLSKKIIEGIEITLPQKEEQQAIASVLSSMDSEIAALEAKRKKYGNIKQGMMQQLLTGKIRLL